MRIFVHVLHRDRSPVARREERSPPRDRAAAPAASSPAAEGSARERRDRSRDR